MSFKTALSALFSLFVFTGATAAFAAPPCAGCQSGGQCTINGKTHTCGFSGGTRCILVGDLTGAEADKACDCLHDKTKPCNSSSAVDGTPTRTKTKASAAPAKPGALSPTGR